MVVCYSKYLVVQVCNTENFGFKVILISVLKYASSSGIKTFQVNLESCSVPAESL